MLRVSILGVPKIDIGKTLSFPFLVWIMSVD